MTRRKPVTITETLPGGETGWVYERFKRAALEGVELPSSSDLLEDWNFYRYEAPKREDTTMRCVVYDIETLEPITVITLQASWVRYLKEQRVIRIPIKKRLKEVDLDPGIPATLQDPFHWVQLESGLLAHKASKAPPAIILFTHNAELVLTLDPTILAGQQSAIQQAYSDGLLEGLLRVIPPSFRTSRQQKVPYGTLGLSVHSPTEQK